MNASQLLTLKTSVGPTIRDTLAYTYDPLGNRTRLTDRFGLHQYAYDALSRLTSADHPLASALVDEAFTYDSVGNRLTSQLSALHVHDAGNRLLEDSQFTYAYDANGNRTSKTDKLTGAVTTYTYDVENQLTQVSLPTGSVASYRYDGLGRRIEKTLDGVSTRDVYDQEDRLAVFDTSGCWRQTFVHGPGIDQPLVLARDTNHDCGPRDAAGHLEPVVFFRTDALGSIVALTDDVGTVLERTRYDSFGQVTITDPAGTTIRPVSAFGNPYAFTGREWDVETGLYDYRARSYDPHTGTFLQEDPLWSVNRYPYVGNNPVRLTDPSGRVPLLLGAILFGALLGGFSAGFGAAIAGGNPRQVVTAAALGVVAGGTGAAVAGTSLLTSLLAGSAFAAVANIATQVAGGAVGSNFNFASLGVALGTGAIATSASFGLGLVAGGPSLTATLASVLGAELPIDLLGASIDLNVPSLSFQSIRQQRFFKEQRKTCFLDRA